MAGAKPTDAEKDQLRQLSDQGYTIEEIQQKFPHIDGRSISGVHVRVQAKKNPPETRPPDPGAGGEAPGASALSNTTISGTTEPAKTPQQQAAENLGFTPAGQTLHNPGGFKPLYREYFIIKKLDPPNDGVQKTEYPPFTIQELYTRYPTGEYEVQHYREGRLFSTYKDKIVKPDAHADPNAINRQGAAPVQRDPADMLLKGVDIFHRLHSEAEVKTVQAEAVRAQAEVAKETARAQVEQSATVGLIELVKEQSKPKPDAAGPAMDKILVMMQQERTNADERHRHEMVALEKKTSTELERERLHLKSDQEKFEKDLQFREQMQKEFLTKMSEVDQQRQTLWKESYEKMISEIRELQTAYGEDLKEKKGFMDKYFELQQKHTDELIALKKSVGTGQDSLKMAEIVKDGIVGGLDRVGARIDMLADKGIIGPGGQPAGPQKITGAAPAGDGKAVDGARDLAVKDSVKEAVKEPWFQELQEEIALTVKRRKEAPSPNLKPHGTLLGQSFIDKMNREPRIRTYFHYLITRYWHQIMADAGEGIKAEYKELFKDPEAEVWFTEFQSFLTASWNASIGVGKK